MSILRWSNFCFKCRLKFRSWFNCWILIFIRKLIGSIFVHVQFWNKFNWSLDSSAIWKFEVAAIPESFDEFYEKIFIIQVGNFFIWVIVIRSGFLELSRDIGVEEYSFKGLLLEGEFSCRDFVFVEVVESIRTIIEDFIGVPKEGNFINKESLWIFDD